MKHIKDFDGFLNESNERIFEEEIDYKSHQFAIVLVGGSIGATDSFPVFVRGQWGTIVGTSNDKEELKVKAKRMNKYLSPGERKYYRMKYTVVELTRSKVKEIDELINKRSSSPDTEVV